jgi:hypothetical protein
MSKSLSLVILSFVSFSVFSQDLTSEVFKADMNLLYKSAKLTFKDIKQGPAEPQSDGTSRFKPSYLVQGAKECYISVDAEKSQTYVAVFEFKNQVVAEKFLEEMIAWTLEATAEYTLARSKGTEMRYLKFQKHTIEFPSDNIDIMGRYPSFSLGVLKDSQMPAFVEVMINEPLWK